MDTMVQLADGTQRRLTAEEIEESSRLPPDARVFRLADLASPRVREARTGYYPIEINKKEHFPRKGEWKTHRAGIARLKHAGRLAIAGNTSTFGYLFSKNDTHFLETEAHKRRTGQTDIKAERHANERRRPLSEHLADFQQYLADKQNSDKHVELICSRVGKLIDDCGAKHVGDLTDAAVMAAIGAMKTGSRLPRDAAHVYLRHRGQRGIGQDLPRVGPAFDPDPYHRPVFPRPVTRPDGGR